MEVRVKTLEGQVKTLQDDNKALEKRVSEIEGNRQLQDFQYKTIIENIQEMKQDIKEMKETPSKRWDLVITGIITAIVGGLIAIVINNLF